MRHIKQVVSTGCLFFCLGGWVYNGQALRAEEAAQVKEAVMTAAVAAAAAPGASDAAPTQVEQKMNGSQKLEGAQIAQATDAPAGVPAAAPTAATKPAGEPTSTNLNSAVVNVGVEGNVEQINLQDIDINTALHFLSLQTKRNIIASKDVKGTVTVNLYNVTFAQALDALLKPNGFDYIEKGNFVYVYTSKELEEIRKRDRKPANRIYRLHYITSTDASVLIKPLLSSSGVVALTPPAVSGLPEGTTDTGGMGFGADDTLVINDYVENLIDVDKALKQLDVRPKQVLVESTILRASLSEDNAMGIDFVSLSGVDFSNLGSLIGTNSTSGGSGTTGITTPGQFAGVTNPNGNTQANIGTDFASKVPQGGLSVGFLSNHVNVLLRALEEITDTTVVANPKILTLNKHKGEVFIGSQFGYKTTTTSQTTTQETVQFLDTGTKLIFRPYIGDDGYVRMEIHPEDSSGGLDGNGLPQKVSTEVTTNVMVKDGRTVVIGGLFRELTTAGRGQVPVLGNIPVLGVPFRRTNDTTERTETIVLLTPHIINDDTSLYDEAEKQAQDVNRMMLGNRAGLQPWGRDRIAQLWYGKAQEAYEQNCPDKALMYIDWALNTNPRFIEAIKFREKLTSKKMEEPDTSSVSRYVRDVIHDDAASIPDSGGSGHYPPPLPMPTVTPAEGAATMPAAH
jgi:type IV pilus assembly protein PilQ